ncbi:MFS transporter [Pseudomonas sp. B21-032]|uniref:MFS transporter n=1 Tax=unclassified Pseudomonas TaxID=196821 RepID=UPI0005EB70D4|nr:MULTISPECIES: MFS transporter [unclassified Pseudomonas]UVL63623.1 MFS transporter [Pseudomonas sp. B21-032]SDQ80682.1 D-galactonate transporter [Pseudomonas sp. UC 17F4]
MNTGSHLLYRKIAWKILPLLFVSYIVSYLDRVNIGFAALRMQQDLNFSDAVYGLGAGVFFLGYVLFEVPSNLLLTRIGARKTIMRIMISWGLVSSCMMFVQTPLQFYLARFFLGVFEAGFFPGIILYLTYWFPVRMRGSVIAVFMSAIAIAGILGGPLSGWIIRAMEGVHDLHGWQWMFLLEGAPAVILGILAGFLLIDRPEQATWLSREERQRIAAEVGTPTGSTSHALGAVVRDPRIYALALVYFSVMAGLYILGFWLPGMIKSYGVDDPFHIGLLTAVPYIASAVGMIVIGRHSDAVGERRWHLASCMLVAACALIACTLVPGNLVLGLVTLSVAAVGLYASMPLFWTIPTRYLGSESAAGGIALINSLALFGGFTSPTVLGLVKASTGSLDIGLYLFAGLLVVGAGALILALPARLIKESPTLAVQGEVCESL